MSRWSHDEEVSNVFTPSLSRAPCAWCSTPRISTIAAGGGHRVDRGQHRLHGRDPSATVALLEDTSLVYVIRLTIFSGLRRRSTSATAAWSALHRRGGGLWRCPACC